MFEEETKKITFASFDWKPKLLKYYIGNMIAKIKLIISFYTEELSWRN